MEGTKIIVVDPENEYKELIHAFGGQPITIKPNSYTSFNPFDVHSIKVQKLKSKAQKLLQEKKYTKAYKTLSKIKNLKEF